MGSRHQSLGHQLCWQVPLPIGPPCAVAFVCLFSFALESGLCVCWASTLPSELQPPSCAWLSISKVSVLSSAQDSIVGVLKMAVLYLTVSSTKKVGLLSEMQN